MASRFKNLLIDNQKLPMNEQKELLRSEFINWKGESRHWHAGILWYQDERLPHMLLEQMAKQTDIIVGDNEPYDGALRNEDDLQRSEDETQADGGDSIHAAVKNPVHEDL